MLSAAIYKYIHVYIYIYIYIYIAEDNISQKFNIYICFILLHYILLSTYSLQEDMDDMLEETMEEDDEDIQCRQQN